ncbi:hypothetical protein BC828DRAFT_374728 [Blastocladiella britannica]|nr:hypothetical protein BC828DRAFT_374728 [Blastocladiella britannica]
MDGLNLDAIKLPMAVSEEELLEFESFVESFSTRMDKILHGKLEESEDTPVHVPVPSLAPVPIPKAQQINQPKPNPAKSLDATMADAALAFARAEWSRALDLYTAALALAAPSDRAMRAKIHANLAAVHLHLKQWDMVVRCSEEALALDLQHAKAHWRRARALQHLAIDASKSDKSNAIATWSSACGDLRELLREKGLKELPTLLAALVEEAHGWSDLGVLPPGAVCSDGGFGDVATVAEHLVDQNLDANVALAWFASSFLPYFAKAQDGEEPALGSLAAVVDAVALAAERPEFELIDRSPRVHAVVRLLEMAWQAAGSSVSLLSDTARAIRAIGKALQAMPPVVCKSIDPDSWYLAVAPMLARVARDPDALDAAVQAVFTSSKLIRPVSTRNGGTYCGWPAVTALLETVPPAQPSDSAVAILANLLLARPTTDPNQGAAALAPLAPVFASALAQSRTVPAADLMLVITLASRLVRVPVAQPNVQAWFEAIPPKIVLAAGPGALRAWSVAAVELTAPNSVPVRAWPKNVVEAVVRGRVLESSTDQVFIGNLGLLVGHLVGSTGWSGSISNMALVKVLYSAFRAGLVAQQDDVSKDRVHARENLAVAVSRLCKSCDEARAWVRAQGGMEMLHQVIASKSK